MPTPVGGFVRNRPYSLLPTSIAPSLARSTNLDPFAVMNRINAYNSGLQTGTQPPQRSQQSLERGTGDSILQPTTGRLQSLIERDAGFTGQTVQRNQQRYQNAQQERQYQQSRSNRNRALSGAPQQQQGTTTSSFTGPDAQLVQYMKQAGWADKDIPMGIAIIHAESGGRADAVNRANRNGSVDTGLFQVNSIHRNGAAAGLNLYDPVQNAKAALNVFNAAGGSWRPWSTFNNGAYRKFYVPTAQVTTQAIPVSNTVQTVSGIRNLAVQNARAVIGLPYVWGGNSLKTGVDCSGLVQQIYGQLGVKFPRTANEQSHYGVLGHRAPINELKPGDLIAWQGNRKGMGPTFVGHIAIYAGNGRIIEAPSQGMRERERSLRAGENIFGVALNFA